MKKNLIQGSGFNFFDELMDFLENYKNLIMCKKTNPITKYILNFDQLNESSHSIGRSYLHFFAVNINCIKLKNGILFAQMHQLNHHLLRQIYPG